MSQDTIRVGFIGTGGNARGHIAAMDKIAGVEVGAFADPSEASLQQAEERLGRRVETFYDYKEMVDQVPLDAVVISTPHTLHYEQVAYCLSKGLHVQVEKPMTCTSADARSLISQVEATGKVLCIGYQRHFEPRFRWVKEQIDSGKLGRITFTQCFQGQNWLRSQQGKWRLDPALSGGGQLNDSGSHLVDILLWITGLEAEEVSAFVDFRGEQVDINSAVNVRFTNGAVGNISILGDQVASGMWEDVTIAGEKGIIWLRQGGRAWISTEDAPDATEVTDFGVSVGNKDENFIAAIRDGAEVQVPPICGLRVIELTEAVWRSAERSAPVKVEKAEKQSA